MKLPLIFLFCSALFITVFSSCHQKGCTNKNAVNFNVTADEDDGSCIVCNTVETVLDSEKVYLKDKRFGSPHYNQIIARFSMYQNVQSPNDKACGKENCTVSLDIKSMVNQKMYLSYSLNRVTGPVYLNYYDDITIDTSETIHVDVIEQFNNPPFINISYDSINVASNDIIYF